MNEKNRKTLTNVAVLALLLGVLAFSFVKMTSALNAPRQRAAARTERTEPTATRMPVVPTTSQGRLGEPSTGAVVAATDMNLNPNQFRVYDLSPPKNPFVRQEEWYAGELAQVPGYPQLKSSDYFERSEAFLPDLALIDEHEWESVRIQRKNTAQQFQISGASEDGTITTTVDLAKGAPEDQSIEWFPESGVPLTALKSPDWYDRYGPQLVAAAQRRAGLGIPDSVDGGLDVTPASEDMREGVINGDKLYVVGISRKDGRARALISVNDQTRMVSEGGGIPTHWQVLEIKEDGIVLIDLHDGSSRWVGLSAPPKVQSGRGGRTSARRSGRDA